MFIWVSVTKEEKFRLLRKLRTRCKFFIKVRTAGVCFPHKAKDRGAFPRHIRMETAHEFNDDTYFPGGGWFLVFSAVLYRYGMEAVPGVNVGDRGRRGKGDKAVASAARQKVKKASFFWTVFTHMLYVAC